MTTDKAKLPRVWLENYRLKEIPSKLDLGDCTLSYLYLYPDKETAEDLTEYVPMEELQLAESRIEKLRAALESFTRLSGKCSIEILNGHNDNCKKYGCYGHFEPIVPSDLAKQELAADASITQTKEGE